MTTMTPHEEYPGQAADIEHERDVNAALTGLTAEVEAASLACGQALRYLTRLTDGDAWDIELAETGTGSDAADGLAAAARELRGVKRIVEARIALFDEADEQTQLGKVQELVDQFEDGADAFDTVKAIGDILAGRTPAAARAEETEVCRHCRAGIKARVRVGACSHPWVHADDEIWCANGLTRAEPAPADAPAEPEPVLDPDCRDGKCGSCTGGPCECFHHLYEELAGRAIRIVLTDANFSVYGVLDHVDRDGMYVRIGDDLVQVHAGEVGKVFTGLRLWTPNQKTAAGTTITAKRACNGCGLLLGDLAEAETYAAVNGPGLPDVTGECPTCSKRDGGESS